MKKLVVTLTIILTGFPPCGVPATALIANQPAWLRPAASPEQNDLTVSLVPGYFDGCGVLVQGVECVPFKADAGGLYLLDSAEHFEVGERLWVRGVLDPYCFTVCMQGNGCIECDTIWPYSRCDLDADGNVDTTDFAILIRVLVPMAVVSSLIHRTEAMAGKCTSSTSARLSPHQNKRKNQT